MQAQTRTPERKHQANRSWSTSSFSTPDCRELSFCVAWLARSAWCHSMSLCSGRGCRAVLGCPRPMGHRIAPQSCLSVHCIRFCATCCHCSPATWQTCRSMSSIGRGNVVHAGSLPMRLGCPVQHATRLDHASASCWRQLYPPGNVSKKAPDLS